MIIVGSSSSTSSRIIIIRMRIVMCGVVSGIYSRVERR